jgi:predicted flap endonuclease-1-like 5' DNA nuclease
MSEGKKKVSKSGGIGSEFAKEIAKQVNAARKEAAAQIKELSKQVAALKKDSGIAKMISSLEAKFEKKFQHQMKEVSETTDKIVKQAKDEIMKAFSKGETPVVVPKKAVTSRKPSKKPATKKTTAKKVTASPKAKAPQNKAAPKKASKAKPVAKAAGDLSNIKGIGPASIKKLESQGIKSISELANPTKEQLEALKGFRNIETWIDAAKKING